MNVNKSSLAGALRGDNANTGGTVQRALRTVREHLDMDVAYISDLSGERWELLAIDRGPDAPDLGPVGTTLDKDCTYCYNIAEGRLPKVIQDTSQEEVAAALDATEALCMRAHISVPLRDASTGDAFGMFCCFAVKPNPTLQERDLNVMEAFAEICAAEIQREVFELRAYRDIKRRVRGALEPAAMTVVFQPIFNLANHSLYAAEALCRITSEPRRGPEKWLAEADTVAMRQELEFAAIANALDVAPFDRGCAISVNASPDVVLDPDFPLLFREVPPSSIILEITEQMPVEDYGRLAAALRPLRDAGMGLAVDDVGGGYSSFRHIIQLKPDLIKADMSLIRNIERDPARQALVAAMVGFSQASGCDLLAEGVETEAQLSVLIDLGVDLAQGFILGRPRPAAELDITGGDGRAVIERAHDRTTPKYNIDAAAASEAFVRGQSASAVLARERGVEALVDEPHVSVAR